MKNKLKLVLTTSLITFSLTTPAQGVDSATTYKSIDAAIKVLKVAPESRAGYVRTKFKHWSDLDKNGCNTRNDVIIAEAKVKPTVEKGCKIVGGSWYSAYDGLTVDKFSALDVDHMVPLAEAWDSGASSWTPDRRQIYANDMGDPVSLIAVTAATNRSKSDQDPSEWLPAKDVCTYIYNWVQVKVRWSLAVDDKELKAIKDSSAKCPKSKISVVIFK